ncbi:MAG: cytochrome C [Rhodoferax sp.]|nr:cytochrome C [Rhodoferax sp.]
MRLKSSLLLSGLGWLLGACLSLPTFAASSATEATPAKLDNATCLNCHDGQKGKLEVPVSDGKARALRAVMPEKFAQGVHAKMTCVACHADIKDNAEKANAHAKDPALKLAKVDCAGCHQQLWEDAQKAGTAQTKPRLELVVKNIDAYKTSFHARPNADDKTKPNASCDNCHDTHSFNVPAKKTPQYDQWRLGIATNCGSCHEDQLDAYSGSVHGKEVLEKKNVKAAVCTDCHSTHAITSSSADPFKLAVTDQCGSCHEENLKTYMGTYHGQISTLGYAYTAKCYDCHGSHKILKADDPKSMVHANNRLKTCQSCHSGKKELALAPAGFATYQPHGHAGDFDKYPQIWVAWQIMLQLLVGTFGFFWLHTLLWFYREFKERKEKAGQPHIKLDNVPEQFKGKHVRRFSAIWRLAHITFALSLMVLTLTGIPLFYPSSPWAVPLMTGLGGPHTAGIIHRISAVIFAGVFFWHIFYITWRIAKNWSTFKFFGPDSLVPNLQDGKDMLAMFKWFFGMGPRPKFDRWTYWEKFDYWAPFWGVTIIGVSGLMMWLPNFFGAFLPGWVFNVAAIFHAEEAFLAVVFLFTVHFFNNHFRPDKFPVEVVMFTGTFSLEEFKHDHALEYERLVKNGELEKYLVDAPSPAKLTAAKALAFTLIACGLTLLTLVGIGFFTSL